MDHDDATQVADTQPGVARRLRDSRTPKPPVVGRYRTIRKIGEGGMGTVWLAHDPELGRDVAIKVVRHSGRNPIESERRLRREAQALAQVSDPHVVRVFDVGRVDDAIWIAMELVDGEGVDEWSRRQRRSIADIVRVFVQAGRGLEAAHAARLVHRDFKPSNVMVGRGGIVRVLDFGLARALEGDDETPGTPLDAVEDPDALQSRVTASGATVGTPPYMAPEQILVRKLDPRTDEFAFCVALWEVLYGERPFQAPRWPELAAAILSCRITTPEREAEVPKELRAILLRGLATKPAERWPDMATLLAALEPWRRPRRSARLPALVGVAAVAAGVAMLASGEDTCDPGEQQIAGLWNERRADDMRNAFIGSAGASPDDVVTRLDEWTASWRLAHGALCSDGDAPGAQAGLACLDRTARGLGATIDLLLEADPRVLVRASDVLFALPDPSACARTGEAGRDDEIDPALAVEIAEIDAMLARSEALEAAGRYGDALSAAREAVVRAEAQAHPAVLARALWRVGAISDVSGAYADSLVALERAYEVAADARDDRTAASAAIRIARVLADRFDRLREAERWLRQADALVRRVGDEMLASDLAFATAAWHQAGGEYEAAETEYRRSLDLRIAVFGEDHPKVHTAANNLGNTLAAQGRYAEAIELHRRTLASRERMYPPMHPQIAYSLNNLANSLVELKEYDEARGLYERSRAIFLASVGPDSPLLLHVYDNLAVVAYQQKRWSDAEDALQQALALRTRTLGEDHPDQSKTLMNLGNLAATRGREDEALAWYDRALAVRERDVGPDHPEVALLLHNIAGAYARRHDFAAALPRLRRAIEIREHTLPADHPHLFGTRIDFALSAIETGDLEEASAVLERTAASIPSGTDASHRVQVELLRLEVLLGSGRGDEALALARTIHDRIHDDPATYLAEVRAHADFGLARALVLTNGASRTTDELARTALELAPEHTRVRERIREWLERGPPER